jgi:homogentisate 1,2-dioxygenase
VALPKVNIAEAAALLTEPFSMIEVALVDDLAINVYICQGSIARHRHIDEDELFFVQSGAINLETDWGDLVLGQHELAVVPKGVGHRSSSPMRSSVLFLRPRILTERKNGHRRLFVLKGEQAIAKVNIAMLADGRVHPFVPVEAARIEEYVLHLSLCLGADTWRTREDGALLLLVQTGEITLEGKDEEMKMRAGDLTVIPAGTPYRATAAERATFLTLQRSR